MQKSLFFLLFITFPQLILTWWDVGHMLTAAIAQIRLNSLSIYASGNFRQITTAINHLCDNRTRTFIESAVWPDDIKQRQYSMDIWNEWHFVDTPHVTDALIPVVNYTSISMSSIATVRQAANALKNNTQRLTAERSLFARYLIHMVGDIHQPLHSVSLFNHTFPKGDAGGNLLKLKLLNGTVENFHSFWDAGAFRLQNDTYKFVRPMNLQNMTEIKRLATQMIEKYGNEVDDLAKILDPAIWAKQSFLIAQNTTYPFMMNNNAATEEYTNLAYETSRKRITLAGYRLANFAISIFDPSKSHSIQDSTFKNLDEIEKQLMRVAEENSGQLMQFIKMKKNLESE